jgi:hypothetical protein
MHKEINGKVAFWQQKLREFRKSGLTRKAFCERNGLSKSSLDYWFTRVTRQKRLPGLVELTPASLPTPSGGLEVVVAGRYRIEVHGALDPQLFGEVVKALESLA